MGDNRAPDEPTAVVGELNVHSVSFDGVLDAGELLTGTPTIVEETTSVLTLANKAVSTAELTINNQTVIIGRAVQFTATGYTVADSPFSIKITVGTDATPAQTKIKYVTIPVEA